MTKRTYVAIYALVILGGTPVASADAQWWNPISWFKRKKPESAPADATAAGPLITPPDTLPSIIPALDQSRGLEAESRIALYDLLANRNVQALQRLQWLATSPSLAEAPAAPGTQTFRGRGDVLFLLAQAQYRMGMDSAFSANAQSVLASGPARYAPLLNGQLLLSAYRSGDLARVAQLAKSMSQDQTRGLASLVSGLAAYEMKDYAGARSAFAAAKQSGVPYSQYAEYMDVLTGLRGDTTQSGPALTRLEALAQASTGDFADQVRVTAAQLAYESGAYDRAVALANAVTPTSGLAPQALLTKAWSQYKAKDVAGAGQSFAAFADGYGQLPQRDEARLMAAQSLLQLGRTDEAGRLFRLVADSARSEAQLLEGRGPDAMTAAARAIVDARAAGLLFAGDVTSGKTVTLTDAAGSDPQVLASVIGGGNAPLPPAKFSQVVSLADLMKQFGAVSSSLGGQFPQRVLFSPASKQASQGTFARRAEAVLAADIDLALASQHARLEGRNEALRNMQIRGLQKAMQGRGDTLMRLSARVDSTESSLAGVMRAVDTTRSNLAASLVTQVRNVVGGPAYILSVRADSLRKVGLLPAGVDVEGLVAARTDSLISAYPLFMLQDSVRLRVRRVRQQIAESRTAVQDAEGMFVTAASTPQGDTAAAMARLTAARATAQARRTIAENDLVAAVSTELGARAGDLLATLRHDMQAADFGTATTAFFNAIDQGQPPGRPGPSGTSGTTNSPASSPTVTTGAKPSMGKTPPIAAAGTPPSPKK